MADNQTIYKPVFPEGNKMDNTEGKYPGITSQPILPKNERPVPRGEEKSASGGKSPKGKSKEYKKVEDRPDEEKLTILVEQSNVVLVKIQTVFPFDLFPDQLVIDINKVDLVYRYFPGVREVFTMLIKDIKSVNLNTSLLFASLYFEYSGYEQNPPSMNKLNKNDAIMARRVIVGLIACKEQKIDLTKFNKEQLVEKLIQIGETRENAQPAITT